ncbi:hypothetical protein [Streptomyces sp. NPDC087270]|uniref:hypothetical protein n=1 Tax=Streptomyces sp. NPDC087270 TaxID=3365774 RepID=UPI003824C540
MPGGLWATLALGAGLSCLARGRTQDALSALSRCGELVAGSSAAGVLMGICVGGGLTLASRRTGTSARRLALLGALAAAVTFPAELLVVALATGVGPVEMVVTVLTWPVMAIVAARHSTDIAGRTRAHPWLWTAGPSARRPRRRQPSQP